MFAPAASPRVALLWRVAGLFGRPPAERSKEAHLRLTLRAPSILCSSCSPSKSRTLELVLGLKFLADRQCPDAFSGCCEDRVVKAHELKVSLKMRRQEPDPLTQTGTE
jgi:hypothetical protein